MSRASMSIFLTLFCASVAFAFSVEGEANAGERKLMTIDERDFQSHRGGNYGGGKNNKDDKHKRPDPGCEGDPHFTGADNSHFDFSGVPNTTYCILSDAHFHINALFGGYYGKYENNPSKSLTWMRKIGLLWGHHSILLEAREGPSADYAQGYMAKITVDGQDVSIPKAGDKATAAEGKVSISWVSANEKSGDEVMDVYAIDIKGVVSMIVELRPEMKHFRTETDGTVHFDIYFPVAYISDNAHGILGQTFRSDHKDRVSQMKLEYNAQLDKYVVPGENGEGYLDGSVEDYKTSGILETDCKVNRFTGSDILDPETALAMEMSSGGVPSVLGESAASVKLSTGSSTYRRMMKLRLMKRLRLL